MDLLVHYEHFHRIADKSLVEQWMDSGTSKYGKEIYPVLFKYFIGLIVDNREFFLCLCVCGIYFYLYLDQDLPQGGEGVAAQKAAAAGRRE